MLSKTRFDWLAVLILVAAGCGKTEVASPKTGSADSPEKSAVAAANPTATPESAVGLFLEALRTGNDEKATQLLSSTAREKTAAVNRNLTPPASDTARFTIGKVEYVNDDGARVSCTWTDVDEEGKSRSDDAIWVVRREADGWRIAGVAAEVFAGEPPLLLNFEDPEDMFRKQQWVREEIRRRAEAAEDGSGEDARAQNTESPEKPVRR